MASQSRAHRILLTRPAEQGARFAEQLVHRFGTRVTILQSPLIAPRLPGPVLPQGPFRAVIFTSETAVAAARDLPGLPRVAFTVGDRTALAAHAAGFTARSAEGDADALVALLLRTDPGPVLHLHGTDTRGDVVGRLRAAGLRAEGAVVYAQEPQPLTDAAQGWLDGDQPVIVPLFSPRSAALFCAVRAKAPLWLAALSPAVDDAATLPAARRVIAARPDAPAMLDAVADLLASPSHP
jgi:uroporphyrinogen-III synthase